MRHESVPKYTYTQRKKRGRDRDFQAEESRTLVSSAGSVFAARPSRVIRCSRCVTAVVAAIVVA